MRTGRLLPTAATLAPVPIRYCYMFPEGISDLVEKAVESSLPTHASPQCLSACVYMTIVQCGLIDGRPREEVLDPEWEPMRQAREIAPFHPEITEVADGRFRRKQPPSPRHRPPTRGGNRPRHQMSGHSPSSTTSCEFSARRRSSSIDGSSKAIARTWSTAVP